MKMLTGYRAAQLRVIYKLPIGHCLSLHPEPLALVDLFNPFPSTPNKDTGLLSVKRAFRQNTRYSTVVPLRKIHLPIQLTPVHFGHTVPDDWLHEGDVMEKGTVFTLNPFTSILLHSAFVRTDMPPITAA